MAPCPVYASSSVSLTVGRLELLDPWCPLLYLTVTSLSLAFNLSIPQVSLYIRSASNWLLDPLTPGACVCMRRWPTCNWLVDPWSRPQAAALLPSVDEWNSRNSGRPGWVVHHPHTDCPLLALGFDFDLGYISHRLTKGSYALPLRPEWRGQS